MKFVHADPEFRDLISIVATAQGIAEALVEKDYWVTHTLWALQQEGLEVWFKGGTSLSKGFGLIQRFSEDLGLKIEGGHDPLPQVRNWKSKERGPTEERRSFFDAVAALPLRDLRLYLDRASLGERCLNAGIEARYPGHHLGNLPKSMRPFVLLEVGDARVRPFVERPITSWVHEHLTRTGMAGDYLDNRPPRLRCIHPTVTLLEKLDAISRRFQAGASAIQYVRHFEDAAHIILAKGRLPSLEISPRELAQEMFAQKQIRQIPSSTDPAFLPSDQEPWLSIRNALEAIGPMFWGPRINLEDAMKTIRTWTQNLSTE